MASVFTYDPDPPRISSPWSNTPVSTPKLLPQQDVDIHTLGGLPAPAPFLLEGSGISKLNAEPQDGPTEYKLHLLLRPRKSHSALSLPTTSIQINPAGKFSLRGTSNTPPLQARQKRLEHLTTQLLWRLQQSSPYHSQSTIKLVSPSLPESGPSLTVPFPTRKLLPGLEESKGALYEIGVADDGGFIGLTRIEMDESLINLRSMAASLGCKVEILRTVIVGECEIEEKSVGVAAVSIPQTEKLWVVEALVLPDAHHHTSVDAPDSSLEVKGISKVGEKQGQLESQTSQLRVSLTGSTTSGKSSLVGTLSTSVLDSGRGKTRLSLLKHRHEIESGVTSSVAPELIGYHTSDQRQVCVVNYGFGNISSWNDIHNASEGERLVLLLDSAGHPRYRRTTIRGLVSWAPHWTLCCVAADDSEDRFTTDDGISSVSSSADLSRAHLELCLKLDLRVIVVITKLDIASTSGLRNVLSKILSTIKLAGRNPVLLKPDSDARTSEELQTLLNTDIAEVESVFSRNDSQKIVPIVLTSAVKGSGIRKLHALLRYIPISEDNPTAERSSEEAVFHIDEVFVRYSPTDEFQDLNSINILSGHLCYQDMEIGDQVLIGPCTSETPEMLPVEMSRARSYPLRMTISSLHDLSRSVPKTQTLSPVKPIDQLTTGTVTTTISCSSTPPPQQHQQSEEWLPARISSIRNLRLPLRKLLAGQVGTIGIELITPTQSPTSSNNNNNSSSNHPKFRKGMVLLKPHLTPNQNQNSVSQQEVRPKACSGLKAALPSSAYEVMEPGCLVTIYIASVRALVRIISVQVPSSLHPQSTSQLEAETEAENDIFRFDTLPSYSNSNSKSNSDPSPNSITGTDLQFAAESEQLRRERKQVKSQPPLHPCIEVSFLFVGGGREWIRLGSRVLVMASAVVEGGSGLDGVVGVVCGVL